MFLHLPRISIIKKINIFTENSMDQGTNAEIAWPFCEIQILRETEKA